MSRVYLDWNATAPLRPEARAAMVQAMDVVGNPSSVHAEGREAKALIERARGQVARLVGCEPQEVVFTSGATEAAAMPFHHVAPVPWYSGSELEHDAVDAHVDTKDWAVDSNGILVTVKDGHPYAYQAWENELAITLASGEIGTVQPVADVVEQYRESGTNRFVFSDMTQAIGKRPTSFRELGVDAACLSAHKFGGPKGVGALLLLAGREVPDPLLKGGGQEMGRRSGTENVIGIAGFGAAAEAARRDLEAGVWERVEKLRNILEETLASASNETIFVGKDVARLPNTSCFITAGWKGETQVMQMDMAGFAISAGSACSSGKVKESRVLRAMGFGEVEARSAVRVSLGPTTTEAEVMAFAEAWTQAYRRWKARAA